MLSTQSSLFLDLKNEKQAISWQRFVVTYRPLIEHAVRKAGISGQDVDDVIQAVLLQLVKSLPSFSYQKDRGFFRGWLNCVARNKAIDLRRQQSRQPDELIFPESLPVNSSESDEKNSGFQVRLLAAAIRHVQSEFRPRTWACFVLRNLEQQTAAQASQKLGLSENAVFVNSSRVLARIREFCLLHGEEVDDDFDIQ